MSDKTGIEWTDATWNPVTGCTLVSSGCAHCYAKKIHDMQVMPLPFLSYDQTNCYIRRPKPQQHRLLDGREWNQFPTPVGEVAHA